MSKFYVLSSRLYDYSRQIINRELEAVNILKISLFFMGFWVSLFFLSTTPASACELARGIASHSPAIWLDFNGQGTPANRGNRAISIQSSGPSPKYGVPSSCGSAYDFSSNAGGYFFNEVAGGSLFNDGEFTIEALFSINRQTSIDYPTIFIADKQGLSGAIIIRVRTDGSNAGRLEVAMFSNNEIGFYTKKTVDDGNWHHIVVTLGNGKLSAYIDGEYMGDKFATFGSRITFDALDKSIPSYSRWKTEKENWPGLIDEFAIYADAKDSTFAASQYALYQRSFAPLSPPAGLELSGASNSINVSWFSYLSNVTQVRVELNCSLSGVQTATTIASNKRISFSNLKPGERCSARAASINDGGSSPLSMSTSEVVVAGTAPSTAPTSRLSINSSQATVSVSGIASDATEVQITLTCTQSGQRNTTITASQPTATFTGLTTGESCSSYSVARNAWGSSPQGAVSNSELVRGQAPSSMSFISESPIANQLRISWASIPANTTTVDLVLSCQSTGRISRSLSPNDRQAVISDLRSGEQCTPSLTLTNQWGSSPTTTNPAVLIKGSAPLAPSISNIDLLTPQQVIVNYLVPSGATTIDLYLRCSQAGTNTLLNLPSSRTSATFTNAIAGDRCSVSAQAKNEWGTSSESSATSQFTIQGQRPDSPSSAEIKSDVEVVRLTWNNGSGATQTQITLECTKSGTRSFLINTPDRTHLVGALGGELCSAVLISKNQWGESRNGIRTSSVVVESKPVTRPPGNTTIATPKPTNPIINPAPKATKKAPVPKVEAPTSTGKKSSIICIKGGAQQAITAIKPKCPKGWIKKPEVVKKD